jgi:antibiotic biosynthesis monooxygenase (ABM) superfamily enzyme
MPVNIDNKLSRPRFALLVLLGVYPVVTGFLYGLTAFAGNLMLWQRSAILCPLVVVVMVWGLIPIIQKHFAKFIYIPIQPSTYS